MASPTGFEHMAIRPRISELRRKGMVAASGARRRNPARQNGSGLDRLRISDTDAQTPYL